MVDGVTSRVTSQTHEQFCKTNGRQSTALKQTVITVRSQSAMSLEHSNETHRSRNIVAKQQTTVKFK